jgi:hypothetical protein
MRQTKVLEALVDMLPDIFGAMVGSFVVLLAYIEYFSK